ncbi:spore germination protein, partial [Paenibacillus sp. MCAF20]
MSGRIVQGRRKGGATDEKRLTKAVKHESEQMNRIADMPLTASLKQNMEICKNELGESPDIIYRELELNDSNHTPILLIYVQGMIEDDRMNEFVIQPLHRDHYDAETQQQELTLLKWME